MPYPLPLWRGAIALGVCLTVALGVTSPARAGPTGEPEPELRARLAEAIAADGFEDRYVAAVWLTDMSTRLNRYLPKALPDAAPRREFLRLVHAEAARAKVSPELVLAVIQVESRFDRFAVSRSGALGYMQIMPFWLQEIGQPGDNLFHQNTNLRMGCTILRYYLDREGNSYVRALARYNGSSGKPDYPYRVLDALNKRWSPG
jgi:soluble lytic murein transglycosylase-like protein